MICMVYLSDSWKLEGQVRISLGTHFHDHPLVPATRCLQALCMDVLKMKSKSLLRKYSVLSTPVSKAKQYCKIQPCFVLLLVNVISRFYSLLQKHFWIPLPSFMSEMVWHFQFEIPHHFDSVTPEKGHFLSYPVLPGHFLIWINLLRQKTVFSSYSLIFRHIPASAHSLPPILLFPNYYRALFLSTTKVPGLKLAFYWFLFCHPCSSSEANLYQEEFNEHNSSTFTIIPFSVSKNATWPPDFAHTRSLFLHWFFFLQPPQPKILLAILANICGWDICDFLVKCVHGTFPTHSSHSCLQFVYLVGTVGRSLPCNNHTESQFLG